MYTIKKYSYDQAKRLGLKIEPSTKGNYKIDVYNSDGEYIVSIGDKRYLDFPSYYELHGKEEADRHRLRYHQRHKKDNKIRGLLALNILW
jgi:hypothetical protein